jgi:tRNA-splicing ligase RtcB
VKEVRKDGFVPVKSWATTIEDSAWEQAMNLSRLPFALSHIALMPDAHPGYGMPIGGVLFADKVVVPYAVGVDIGCGVSLFRIWSANIEDTDPTSIRAFLDGVRRRVPVGNGPQAQHAQANTAWEPPATTPYWSDVADAAMDKAVTQLGTLGGGNHFIELQQDPNGNLYVMLHSGSRSVGKKVCDHWHKVALGLNKTWFSALPDKELAYLPWEAKEAHSYMNDMVVAMGWAEENRRQMGVAVADAVAETWGVGTDLVVDIHHNYAAWENHGGNNGIVHRKGAVKAGLDDVVLIPGSMGTASYIGRGLGNEDSFSTCQHGAGRARSRGETRRMTNVDAMHEQMAAAGVLLSTPNDADVTDESAIAYKDLEEVMDASTDLVERTTRLTPLGVVKG